MFQASDIDALKSEIDSFKVPVFVAERATPSEEFRILALNETHEAATGMRNTDHALLRISEILPPDQARHVNSRYAQAIQMSAPFQYREELTMPDGLMTWDTTVRPVRMDSGAERVLGHAICVRTLRTDTADLLAFEDVRYFSAEAAFQLSKVTEMFEAMEAGRADLNDLRASVGFLAGICRSVDSTLSEVRARAEARINSAKTVEGSPLVALNADAPQSFRDTAKRLVEMVHTHQRETSSAA